MSAQLLFYPFAFYRDSSPGTSIFSSLRIPGLASGGEYQLDPMSMVCNCQWLDLPQYARRRIIGIVSRLLPGSLSEPEIYPVSGEALQPKALLFQQTASQKLQKQTNVFPGKFAFRISAGGQLYEGFFATILARVPKNPNASSGDRITDFLKKGTAFRGVQLRKHSKAREKRYSFGYAVSFIFACYQILWTFPKSRYLCSRYLPLACG